MKLSIIPEQIIPARYEIVFWEDRQTRDFLIEPRPYETALRADIQAWIDTHDPTMEMVVDRGDFGEGIAQVTLSFSTQAAAEAFHKTWNTGLCKESSMNSCSNMKKIDSKTFSCTVCGEEMKVLDLDELTSS